MTLTRRLARPLLASSFVVGGAHALRHSETLAQQARPVTDRVVPAAERVAPSAPIPTDPKTLVRITAGVQIAAGLMLATDRMPRLSSMVLAGTLVPSTLSQHRFWEESDKADRNHELLHFGKDLSVLGGLLIAALDTEGQPSLGWRAKRAATDARREGRHLAKSARQEARIATSKVK